MMSPKSVRTKGLYKPLANAGIVITRPSGTGSALAARVRALGGRAVHLAGLSLRGPADAAAAISALREARNAEIWIFSSPAAVAFAFKLLPTLRIPQRARVFGVGAGTARALARKGVRAIVPAERSDSEGLLALPELESVRGRKVALVGAPGGRDLIAPALRRRGARVEHVHVYRRERPRLTGRHFAALAATPDPLITLLSSAEALTNLVAIVPAPLLARLRRQMIVVSSDRLALAARAQGFGEIVQAKSALARDLLAAAQTVIARHRL